MGNKMSVSKKMFSVMLLLAMPASANAIGNCLQVEVGGASDRLDSLVIPIPNVNPKDSNPVRIEVQAKKGDGGIIVTPFECAMIESEIVCVQPDGAGDFFLVQKGSSYTFESEYLNFALGATSGLPPRKDEDPINEDYAIIREDSENEETHPERLQLKADRVQCPSAKTK